MRLWPALPLLVACCTGEDPGSAVVVTEVVPAEGHVALSTRLTVRGRGFASGAAVSLVVAGGDKIALADVAIESSAELKATVPAGQAAGEYRVQVGASEPGGSFTVFSGALEITALEVDQGDATLIRAPSGRTLLVDGGKIGQGVDRVLPFLARVGAAQPDFIVVTHFDEDHLGGVVEFLAGQDGLAGTGDERYPKQGLHDHGDNHGCSTATCEKYYALRAAAAGKMPAGAVRGLAPGEELPLGSGARVTVSAVNGELAGGSRVPTADENENSVALLVEFGDFRFFTAGDLTGGPVAGRFCSSAGADVESPVAALVGDISVLRVDHHGSCTSTQPVALDRWKPEVAIISAGRQNSFCHPDQRVLNLLDGVGVKSYLTTAGMVVPTAKCAAMWGDADSDPPQKTVFPASAATATGDIRVSTSDGVHYRVQVITTDGATELRNDSYLSRP